VVEASPIAVWPAAQEELCPGDRDPACESTLPRTSGVPCISCQCQQSGFDLFHVAISIIDGCPYDIIKLIDKVVEFFRQRLLQQYNPGVRRRIVLYPPVVKLCLVAIGVIVIEEAQIAGDIDDEVLKPNFSSERR
jgi:hypothetical protein